jgi:hypothetical protein
MSSPAGGAWPREEMSSMENSWLGVSYVHFVSSLLLHIGLVFIIIYAFLDDFRNFPTKSTALVFNSYEAENLLFRILFVSRLSGMQKFDKNLHDQFFTRRKVMSERNKREGLVQTSTGGATQLPSHATYTHSHLGHRFGPSFIPYALFRQKTTTIFFPRFIEAATEAKVLSYSRRGHILLT